MNISIHIQNLKDIRDLKLDFPIEKGFMLLRELMVQVRVLL